MNKKARAETISSLAERYNVSRQTFVKWLRPFMKDISMMDDCRILTPEQVRLIIEKLGTY